MRSPFLKPLISGSLNIIINTNTINDKEFVRKISEEMDSLLEEGCRIAEDTLQLVKAKLQKGDRQMAELLKGKAVADAIKSELTKGLKHLKPEE